MVTSRFFSCSFSQSFMFILIVFSSTTTTTNAQGLKVGFYEKTCPNAEAIVTKVVSDIIHQVPSLGGPLLRMHFHDCFVRGCDGSVLLDSPNKQAEKDSPPNLSLRGYEVIDRVKTALEKACPRLVSCADIVALVARDVTVALKGPSWEVETGRRDGVVSNLTEALFNLPGPAFNITQLISSFQGKGLSVKDLVVLSGGHTIGTSHCSSFDARIHNFTGKGDADPKIDTNYVKNLKIKCKQGDQTTLVEMDPGSFKTFDHDYYTLVTKRRGLFHSDASLLDDKRTNAYVFQAAKDKSTFFADFGTAMVHMGRIGVLTGRSGEVRKVCSKVN